jgi:hypothetical protein
VILSCKQGHCNARCSFFAYAHLTTNRARAKLSFFRNESCFGRILQVEFSAGKPVDSEKSLGYNTTEAHIPHPMNQKEKLE